MYRQWIRWSYGGVEGSKWSFNAYVGKQTWRGAAKNTIGCEKLRYVAHTNVTQRNIWIKRNVANPTTWHIEKYATQRSEIRGVTKNYATLREKYGLIYGNVTIVQSQNSFQYESWKIACPSFGCSRLSSLIYVNLDSIIYVYITMGPFHWHGLTLIAAWISNYIHYKMRYQIIYPFRNFSVATV